MMMNTIFSKRQRTWMYILLAGLAVITANAFRPASQSNNDSDPNTIVITGYNFGFETGVNSDGLPDGWGRWGTPSYDFIIDSEVKHSGNHSLRIEAHDGEITQGGFGCPRLTIPAEEYTGKTVTLKAFMKLEDVEKPIGLLLRIDGNPNETLAFDNMQRKGIVGTHDWKEYSVTVNLPKNAKTINIGAIHSGKGKLWVDDFQVSINKSFNFGFEIVSNPDGLPDGWIRWGATSYNIQPDSEVKHSGDYSLRVEPKDPSTAEGFGCPAFSIPAIYEGKNVTVKAFLKFEEVKQPIGLLLRVDGSSGSLQFDNMMQRRITGTQDWTEYSVTLPLPENAKTINIGAMLSGTGKLWADDFRILIDDVDISEAKLKPEKTYKAEEDTEFDAGSKINIPTYTSQMADNLELLGRIWGFLKYYHPAVSTGDYNWDAELFRIMPEILKTKNTDERNKIFVEWIDRLGKLNSGKYKTPKSTDVKLQPDLAWMEKPKLGKTLSQKLKEVKNAERSAEHYYIDLHPSVNNPNFKNEKPYAQMNYSDDSGMRLLALFRYWNMIEYFFPYKHLTDQNWNTVLGKFVPVFLDAKNELDYKLALVQLIAHVNDTHANIYSDRALNEWKGVNYAPYGVSFIEGKAVVTIVLNSDLTKSSVLKTGDVITNIDGKPVEKFVEERKPYSPASNAPVQLRNIARDLLRTNADKLSLQIIRDGKPQTFEIACNPPAGASSGNVFKSSHRLLSSDIGYIFPETLVNDSIPIIMEKFKDTKGIIIDWRGYPRKDFTVFTLGAYLSPQPTDFVKFTRGNIEQPGLFTFDSAPLKVGNNNEKCYKGKVVIIVNEQTQSSAEYHTMSFQTAPQATVIGSVTAAADGNVSSIILPGNVPTMITGIGVYYPDGRETQRIGVKLDMEVKPTIRGIIEGRDELLEKAMKIIRE